MSSHSPSSYLANARPLPSHFGLIALVASVILAATPIDSEGDRLSADRLPADAPGLESIEYEGPSRVVQLGRRVPVTVKADDEDLGDVLLQGTAAESTAPRHSTRAHVTNVSGKVIGENEHSVILELASNRSSVSTTSVASVDTAAPASTDHTVWPMDYAPLVVVILGIEATVTAPIVAIFSFREGGLGFEIGDLALTNARADEFTQVEDTAWTALIKPMQPGPFEVCVAAGRISDGVGSTLAEDMCVASAYVPKTPPADTEQLRYETEPTNADTFGWTYMSGAASKQVDSAEIEVVCRQALGSKVMLEAQACDSSYSRQVLVQGSSLTDHNGNVTLPISSVQNRIDMEGLPLEYLDQTGQCKDHYVVDNTAPGLEIKGIESTVTGPVMANLEYSEVVSGFAAEGLTVENVTLTHSESVIPDLEWPVRVSPFSQGSSNVGVADSVSTDNAGTVNTAALVLSDFHLSGLVTTDSLALVSLYDATDGDNWTNNAGWLTDPLDAWFGISLNDARRVTAVKLGNNRLTGEIPPELGALSNLEELWLSGNPLTGPIPPELGALSSLEELRLRDTQLTGEIPAELGALSNLKFLWLYRTQLTGEIPAELGALSNLKFLWLNDAQLEGSIPAELGALSSLEELRLHNNALTGQIPAELGALSSLDDLRLSNNALTGSIPAELGALSELVYLDLGGNELSGEIPPELGDLSSLKYLFLYNNALWGSIPAELGALSDLVYLDLGGNDFSGEIPPELGGLSNLTFLWLSYNALSGEIPEELGDLSSLTNLWLSDNALSGEIPEELGDLSNLSSLRLHRNKLTGAVPSELETLSNLVYLDLRDNRLVDLPDLTGMAALDKVFVHENRLTFEDVEQQSHWNGSGGVAVSGGQPLVPSSALANFGDAFRAERMSELNLMLGLEGDAHEDSLLLADQLLSHQELALELSELGGQSETSMVKYFRYAPQDSVAMEVEADGSQVILSVDVGGTANEYEWFRDGVAIAGETEESLVLGPGDLASLYHCEITSDLAPDLTLYCKKFVPADTPDQGSVTTDSLALVALYNATDGDNWINNTGWLTDPLDDWFGVSLNDVRRVTAVNLESNALTGKIPKKLGELSRLIQLDLRDNSLTGPIPPELGDLSNVEYLQLIDNGLNGPIPSELGDLSNLRILSLSRNELSGAIPPELGDLSKLRNLSLGRNELSGAIPPELGDLSSLLLLWLHNNDLSGDIPPELGDLSNLRVLWLAGNDLSGEIPSELGLLTDLIDLLLQNNNLSGKIPPQLGDLSRLLYLWLAGNDLSGEIPKELGALSSLKHLSLGNNQLSGAIPSELGDLANLESLNLYENQLTGAVPSELGALSNLGTLWLNDNLLVDLPDLTGMAGLDYVSVHENRLTFEDVEQQSHWNGSGGVAVSGGQPPVSTSALANLGDAVRAERMSELHLMLGLEGDTQADSLLLVDLLQGNQEFSELAGQSEIAMNRYFNYAPQDSVVMEVEADGSQVILSVDVGGTANEYEWFRDGVAIAGETEESLVLGPGDLASSYHCEITSDLAPALTLYCKKVVPAFDSGSVTTDSLALVALYNATDGDNWINNTGWLTDPLDDWFGVSLNDARRVKAVELGSNSLTGEIPAKLGGLSNLSTLWLPANDLSGDIPKELGDLSNLTLLVLSDNELSGEIPEELGDLSSLKALVLVRNELSGAIPPELGDLSNLKTLYLRRNEFTDEIPSELGMLSKLINLDLYDNALRGPIPPELGDLSNLVTLELGQNELTGEIPEELGDLSNLTVLSLNQNELSGEIPEELGDLSNLTRLWLHKNILTGAVPAELSALSNLAYLSLYSNRLVDLPDLTVMAALDHVDVYSNRLTFEDVEQQSHWNGSGGVSVSGGQPPVSTSALANFGDAVRAERMSELHLMLGLEGDTRADSLLQADLWLSHQELALELPELGGQSETASDKYFHYAPQDSVPTQVAVDGSQTVLSVDVGGTANKYQWFRDDAEIAGATQVSLVLGSSDLASTYHCKIKSDLAPALTLSSKMAGPWDTLPDPGSVTTDSLALVALYNATDGDNWINNTGWLTDPLDDWFGVSLNDARRVKAVELGSNSLTGEIPAKLGGLSNLSTLWLPANDLSGDIPKELGDLSNLTLLGLTDNALSGEIPEELGDLSSLMNLFLARNELSGAIPPELGDLSNLKGLNLRRNEFTDEIPSELGMLSKLIGLDLYDNALTGPIPPELGDLPNLVRLELGQNELTGEIPEELGDLSNLTVLLLNQNELSGEIPEELGDLSNLTSLWLHKNILTGAVPAELSALSNLVDLYLYSNRLVDLPDLTGMAALDLVSVHENRLTFEDVEQQSHWNGSGGVSVSGGQPPVSTSALANLGDADRAERMSELHLMLGLEGDTRADSLLQADLWLSRQELALEFSELAGQSEIVMNRYFNYAPQDSVPTQVAVDGSQTVLSVDVGGTANKYQWFRDDAEIAGATQVSLVLGSSDLASTYHCKIKSDLAPALTLSSKMAGPWDTLPDPGSVTTDSLALVALYNATDGANWTNNTGWLTGPLNTWHGISLDDARRVIQVFLYNNALTGTLPTDLGNLSKLEGLYLNGNSLSGAIPSELGALSILKILWLHGNAFAGPIPPELGALSRLTFLFLRDNDLTGAIPSELSTLSSLKYLYLNNNNLTGAIPAELGALSNLEGLLLNNNNLSGAIPVELGALSNLTALWLSKNDLSGTIPSELGTLSNLEQLLASNNALSGSIPPELGTLSNLRDLRFFDNQLTGTIPPELSGLSNLEYLRLDENELSGTIPPELGALSNLEYLLLGDNQLMGAIPPELGALSKLKSLVLQGNSFTGAVPSELTGLSNLMSLTLFENRLVDLPDLTGMTALDHVAVSSNRFTFEDVEQQSHWTGSGGAALSVVQPPESTSALANLGDAVRAEIMSELHLMIGLEGDTHADSLLQADLWLSYQELALELAEATGQSETAMDRYFEYSPQDSVTAQVKVDTSQTELSVDVGGTANEYQWFRDGAAIAGETAESLVLGPGDLAALYHCRIKSPKAPHLTLYSAKLRPSAGAPHVVSIVLSQAQVSSMPQDSLHWEVTFSEAVQNVDAYDFVVRGALDQTLHVQAYGGTTFGIQVSGTHLALAGDSVRLEISATHDIANQSGVLLGSTVPIGKNEQAYALSVRNAQIDALPAVANAERLPEQDALEANYPNPFHGQTVLPFTLAREAHVRLVVYDLLGRVVERVVDEPLTAGRYDLEYDGSYLAPGVYVYRIEIGAFRATRSMVVSR